MEVITRWPAWGCLWPARRGWASPWRAVSSGLFNVFSSFKPYWMKPNQMQGMQVCCWQQFVLLPNQTMPNTTKQIDHILNQTCADVQPNTQMLKYKIPNTQIQNTKFQILKCKILKCPGSLTSLLRCSARQEVRMRGKRCSLSVSKIKFY